MLVKRLEIKNFRGIKQAQLHFEGHTLFVGGNNVGKSTVFDALELVLGPDRLSKTPPVEEYDFYNANYLEEDGQTPVPLRVEVVLVGLSEEVERLCMAHCEFWHLKELRLLDPGQAAQAVGPDVVRCLRLESVGTYDPDEDEFEAETFYSYSPNNEDGTLAPLGRKIKRLFGFLYLRTLRTGSRALSLERGSLLDLILRSQGARTKLWEKTIARLRDLEPPIDAEETDLLPIMASIEKRLAQYVAVAPGDRATRLFVSQLSREHLRKTLSFFLSMVPDQEPVPFQEVGSGTLNTLVLALLSLLAETKKENVIFAMEEPEIALPPHTQRRIANYLLEKTTQCFVSSHSPYVIERFEPEQILILRRDEQATLKGTSVASGTVLKGYKREARRGIAEAMLGPGVIVCEGVADQSSLAAVAEHMQSEPECYPLDLSGITILACDGDGKLANFGEFFRSIGLKTYAFYDRRKTRGQQEKQRLAAHYDIDLETNYTGLEALLLTELPINRVWQFLEGVRAEDAEGKYGIPAQRPDDNVIREHGMKVLKSNKGSDFAAGLIGLCGRQELPPSITGFLAQIYAAFPRPAPVPTLVPKPDAVPGAQPGLFPPGAAEAAAVNVAPAAAQP